MVATSRTNLELAYEYGYLDALFGFEFDPRPEGCEEDYRRGFESHSVDRPTEAPVGSYIDPVNWGWY